MSEEITWLSRASELGMADLKLACFSIHPANDNDKSFVKK